MAIISLSILFGTIFLNDFFKLCIHLYGETKRYLRQRRIDREEIEINERERTNNIQVKIEMSQEKVEDLDKRLHRFYIALIKARIKSIKEGKWFFYFMLIFAVAKDIFHAIIIFIKFLSKHYFIKKIK